MSSNNLYKLFIFVLETKMSFSLYKTPIFFTSNLLCYIKGSLWDRFVSNWPGSFGVIFDWIKKFSFGFNFLALISQNKMQHINSA